MYKFFSAIIIALLVLGTSYADEQQAPDATEATPANDKITILTMQCPTPDKLTYDETAHSWSSPPGFKSFSTSFVATIKSFNGAQWNGAGLGQIFCIYYGANEFSFPVMLAYNIMTLEPKRKKGLAWTENLNGYRNCLSHNPEECAFQVRGKAETKDFNTDLEGIKSDTTTDNTSTF